MSNQVDEDFREIFTRLEQFKGFSERENTCRIRVPAGLN